MRDGLHAGRGRRPRARDEPQGGGRLRPGGRLLPVRRRQGRDRLRPVRPRRRGRAARATRRRCGRSWNATGRPARTSGSASTRSTRRSPRPGCARPIEAALLRLADPAAGLARLQAAFAVDVDGIALGEVVGGFGVAEAALAALERAGLAPGATRAVVQGFGSMGGATARYLAAAGRPRGRDRRREGLVAEPGGLDVERLLLTRDAHGAIDRTALRRRAASARGPTGSRSTPSCSSPPRCPT